MLGFDTLYWSDDPGDPELARISCDEERMLLTRDRGLLKRSIVTHGYYVQHTNPRQQLVEVLRRFDLFDASRPFRRCTRCNGLLEPVCKEDILDRLPAQTRRYYDEFCRCQSCGQIYWKGSYFERMQRFVDGILQLNRD